MIGKLIGWIIKRKFQTDSGELVYQGISLTKLGLVLMAVLKAVESISNVMVSQGFLAHAIVIPLAVYEFIAALTGIAARDAIVHPGTDEEPV